MNFIDEMLEELRETGWVQGGYTIHDDHNQIVGRCILGAARYVSGQHCNVSITIEVFEVLDSIEKVIDEQYADRLEWSGMTVIPAFNDNPETTFEDVERVLEKASVKLAEME